MLRPLRLSLVATLIGILAALGFQVVPAQAADPILTSPTLKVTGGNRPADLLTVTAKITSAAGVPTGSVRFTGNALDLTVPLGADGTATVQTPAATATQRIEAAFTGTGGFADCMTSEPLDALTRAVWEPGPTIARLAPVLALTLTTAARLRNRVGAPLAGVTVAFTLVDNVPEFPEPGSAFPVCTAVTDATGFASCKGKALLSVIVSILTGGAYATRMQGFFATDQYTKLPVLLTK